MLRMLKIDTSLIVYFLADFQDGCQHDEVEESPKIMCG